ncbi:MarR family transcriptional regulator [Paenibacillus sp. CMAA1739]|uniref:MarR family winged helix-turn-helix transcriptional regulator n=1 Tax=Paenibacillus ottowii TaxID=2315729 RepID=UPI0027311EC3|nr:MULTISPECIES: MarR family transcriptional regulator [Paenibacillus]MDP1509313.1 MarR family transcriptional regulator [Paenibacillus ottowii]MEC4564560.1 MarR family transcriptional regulator [Paenibacillus sp. CMAA1739]
MLKGGEIDITQTPSEAEYIFDLLLLLNKQISSKFERCAGISASRLQLLCKLYQVEEISQTLLQKEIGIDGAAVTRHLKQLEATEMVTRRTKPEDNRVTLVSLTDYGRARIVIFKQERSQFVAQLLQSFDEIQRQQLADMLQVMNSHISNMD